MGSSTDMEKEMANGIRSLSDVEIDIVSGAWKNCDNGTTSGGGPGLYPDYADCNDDGGSLVDGILVFYKAATGKDLTL